MNLSVSFYLVQIIFIQLFIAGILFFWKQKRFIKSKKRILELENEMLACHSEILSLHKEISGHRYPEADIEQHRLYAVDKKKEA